jgi:DNA-binding HxlR family transcriptional regulator
MRTYGQYCPIARASEVLATRWTPLILRNLLLGATTFTEIADGAPGIPRTLLASRLRELERSGVVARTAQPGHRGSAYHLTEAGEALRPVMFVLGSWGERWMELAPEHLDPGVVLDSWRRWYLAEEALPPTRVVVRFDFPDRTRKSNQLWMIFDGPRTEVCRNFPGYLEDVVVTVDSRTLAEWHLGRADWLDALRSGHIAVAGPPRLARALPTWNRRSGWAKVEGIRPPSRTRTNTI